MLRGINNRVADAKDQGKIAFDSVVPENWNVWRDCGSTMLGIATGGILGTIARKFSRADTAMKHKVVIVTAATVAAVAAAFAISPALATFLLLKGWLMAPVIGTPAAFALAEPGLKSNAELQQERQAAAERHFQREAN
jgi:hypothetical protein